MTVYTSSDAPPPRSHVRPALLSHVAPACLQVFFDLFSPRSEPWARVSVDAGGRLRYKTAIDDHGQPAPLSPDVIAQHLQGTLHVGVHPPGAGDTTRFLTLILDARTARSWKSAYSANGL